MKNMTLPVRNSNRSYRLFIAGLTVLALFFSGCKDKEEVESLISDQPTPTWAVAANYDMTASMSAIVKVDLSLTYPKQITDPEQSIAQNDLLAAFAGDQCVGVTSPVNGLFFLYIVGNAADQTELTLQYYSAILKNTFIAKQTLTFKNDAQEGTVNNPIVPEFVVLQKK